MAEKNKELPYKTEEKVFKIRKGTNKSKLLIAIGICGQLRSSRAEYFINSYDVCRREINDLINKGFIKEICKKQYSKDSIRLPHNLILTKEGKKELNRMYPDIYKYHLFTINNHYTNVIFEYETVKKIKARELYKSTSKAIDYLRHSKKKRHLYEEYKKDFLEIDPENVTTSDLRKFAKDHPAIDIYHFYNFKYKQGKKINALRRVLNTSDINGYIFKENIRMLFNEKPTLKREIKDTVEITEPYYYQSREIKKVAGKSSEYSKATGVIYTKKQTYTIYTIDKASDISLLEPETKFKEAVNIIGNSTFKDYKLNTSCLLFARDKNDDILKDILSGKSKEITNNIMSVYRNVYFIPFSHIYKTGKEVNTYTDVIFNTVIYNYKENLNKGIIKSLEKVYNGKAEISKNSRYDIVIRRNDEKGKSKVFYIKSFLDFNISGILRFIKEARENYKNKDAKYIIVAYPYQKNSFNFTGISDIENIEIKYIGINGVKFPKKEKRI